MPDKPTPSPSDPEPEGKGLPPIPDSENQPSDEVRPKLKLNRLIVKDIEITPQVKPDAEPVPRAEPISEPDPPPPGIKEPPVEAVAPPIEPVTPSPEEPEIEEESDTSAAETPEEPEVEKRTNPPAKKRGTGRRLVFPIILIIGSLLYGIHIIFDPLGWKSPESGPAEPQLNTVPSKPEDELAEVEEKQLAISNVLSAGAKPNIHDYLDNLGRQDLKLSNSPKGIFINSVFYEEGMPLNPSFGLTVESIPDNTEEKLIIMDEEGNTYPIEIP